MTLLEEYQVSLNSLIGTLFSLGSAELHTYNVAYNRFTGPLLGLQGLPALLRAFVGSNQLKGALLLP
eukprot:3642259-Amphidinium_carterae.1